MSILFVDGSRHLSRLPGSVGARLGNVVNGGLPVIVGDAEGVDEAVQQYPLEASYERVTLFCSGDKARNDLGGWQARHVHPTDASRGFQFFAAKDGEMARMAEFGLMIWDGRNPGTVPNVPRLVRAAKISVLLDIPGERSMTIKNAGQWREFLRQCRPGLRRDFRERATDDEWLPSE